MLTEKTKHNLKPESCFIWWTFLELQAQARDTASQINAEKTVPKRQGRKPDYIEVFATNDQVVGTSKDYC